MHSNRPRYSEVQLPSIHLEFDQNQHKTTFTETNGLPSSSIAMIIKKIHFLGTNLDLGNPNSRTL